MESESIPEPARSPLTTTDGLEKLFWKSWNPKKPIATITFVHGQSEHCGRYDSIFENFAKSRIQVICFDLRGHGHSSGVRGHTPFDKIFEDIDLMYTKSDPDVPHFIFGHSMGGLLVTSWILSRQKLGKLPPLAGAIISAPLFALTHPVPILGLIASFLSTITPTTVVPSGVKPEFTSRDAEQVKLYAKDPLNHGRISFRSGKDAMEYGKLCLEHASKFSVPVLFAHGGADEITDPKATEQFFNAIGSSDKTLKIYPGWYHELHFEPAEASREVLLNYENWIVDRVLSKKHKEQSNVKTESKEIQPEQQSTEKAEKATEKAEEKEEKAVEPTQEDKQETN